MLAALSAPELAGTICFLCSLAHIFSVKMLQRAALRFPQGSVGENFFHLLGELEVVFGLWAALYFLFLAGHSGFAEAVRGVERLNFTEPGFVFVIMVICATRPVLRFAESLISGAARLLPFPPSLAFFLSALSIGPLVGSLITEPAAMTVTALLLLRRYFREGVSESLKYSTLGLLFVNVSIGGTLTPFAAPPVLMVAGKWGWDFPFMLSRFGWKAALAVLLSTSLLAWRFRGELRALPAPPEAAEPPPPFWITALHLAFLAVTVLASHHLVVFAGIFLFFLGLVTVTKEYQSELRLREGLLVGFFLGGLVVLGAPQRWWLEPLLASMGELALFGGATVLTAVVDNAALTYLGAQVPGLSEASRYALVAGAVTGGGLTVIANAPNPAGYGILNSGFGEEGISPARLFLSALSPTLIAAACFTFL